MEAEDGLSLSALQPWNTDPRKPTTASADPARRWSPGDSQPPAGPSSTPNVYPRPHTPKCSSLGISRTSRPPAIQLAETPSQHINPSPPIPPQSGAWETGLREDCSHTRSPHTHLVPPPSPFPVFLPHYQSPPPAPPIYHPTFPPPKFSPQPAPRHDGPRGTIGNVSGRGTPPKAPERDHWRPTLHQLLRDRPLWIPPQPVKLHSDLLPEQDGAHTDPLRQNGRDPPATQSPGTCHSDQHSLCAMTHRVRPA
ncbi:pollen-specific leucine-rich repeat extensin-like protein 1 [Melanotaenia boesemani]|uniref:pollen-specific leucine-rich repeat extensin-like protein 1 n=1 Tax=Melanotaenia boesemani TaxID=1250792 RepID=UPI001C040738|nr:pollen-specific leucine-rich repeat extensin-like protein 1 [Melanotaenia boesemani]